MKTKNTELEVDFIGSQEPLTAEEEKALSEYFRRKKLFRSKKIIYTPRHKKRIKESV
jgi:3-deoxy-D-manno-octulosonic-acid transferase